MDSFISILRKIILLIIAIYLFLSSSFGQNDYVRTVIPGKTWELREEWGSMFPAHRYKMYVTCDTTILNGQIYHNLEVEDIYQQQHCGIGGYLREDTVSQRVYYISLLEIETPREILIADYSLEKGDTFIFDNTWKVVVDTVKYVNRYGETGLKVISFGTSVLEWFLEGVGRGNSGPIDGCRNYGWITGVDQVDLECNQLTSTESLEKNYDQFEISPNPVKNQMRVKINTIKESNIPYEIRSIDGKLYRKGFVIPGENYLNIDLIPKGVLLVRLQFQGQMVTQKVIHY